METAISSSTCMGKAWKEQKRTHTYRARIGRCKHWAITSGPGLVERSQEHDARIGRLLVVPRCINVCNRARKHLHFERRIAHTIVIVNILHLLFIPCTTLLYACPSVTSHFLFSSIQVRNLTRTFSFLIDGWKNKGD